ncbi:hypothetical protein [Methylobacterium nonmethylotrophicum]|nr:hypothetical protein [Methylobacterium nonmethylotrophicum]
MVTERPYSGATTPRCRSLEASSMPVVLAAASCLALGIALVVLLGLSA